jgi:hypothetical protein
MKMAIGSFPMPLAAHQQILGIVENVEQQVLLREMQAKAKAAAEAAKEKPPRTLACSGVRRPSRPRRTCRRSRVWPSAALRQTGIFRKYVLMMPSGRSPRKRSIPVMDPICKRVLDPL